MRHPLAVFSILALCSTAALAGEGREEKVRGDRKRVEAQGFWLYNDLKTGFADATSSGKPMVVALRCIPCEDCVKLDDDLVDQSPQLRPLLEKFVRVPPPEGDRADPRPEGASAGAARRAGHGSREVGIQAG